jgi:hypothetical protein
MWQADPHFRSNKPLLKSLPLEQVEAIMNDPTWTKAVFFRDPAKRLLSAYLDKFVKNRDYSVTVFEQGTRSSRGNKMSYRDFVGRVTNCTGDDGCTGTKHRPGNLGRYSPNGLHTRTNPHWKPHLYMTNLFKFLPAFNFFGSFDHLGSHTKELLSGLGLWESYGASGWGKGGGEPMFMTNTVYHRTTGTSNASKASHSDAATEQAIRGAYWMDYAVMEQLGVFEREEASSSLAESLLTITKQEATQEDKHQGGHEDRNAEEQRLGGPFGGTIGDGTNRERGSWGVLPRPLVVPTFKAAVAPVWGQRWDLADLIEGFGPGYGP